MLEMCNSLCVTKIIIRIGPLMVIRNSVIQKLKISLAIIKQTRNKWSDGSYLFD